MCGIVAAIAQRPVQSILIEGLKRLEYRGYDSAGLATLNDHHIERTRAQGKVAELEALLTDSSAHQGIASPKPTVFVVAKILKKSCCSRTLFLSKRVKLPSLSKTL